MISMGSSAALKNLLSAKPENDESCFRHVDSTARSLGLAALPGLHARKQKALEQELDQTLAETCDNIEPSMSPTTSTVGLRDDKLVLSLTERDVVGGRPHRSHNRVAHKNRQGIFSRSDSKESVTSTHSDSVYERLARMGTSAFDSPMSEPRGQGSLRDEARLHVSLSDSDKIAAHARDRNISDRRFLRRYNKSMNRAAEATDSDSNSDLNQNASVLDQIVEAENGLAAMNIENEPDPTRNEEMRISPIQAWESEAPPTTNRQLLSSKEDTSSGRPEKDLDAVQSEEIGNVRPEAARRNRCSESDYEGEQEDKPIDFTRRYPSDHGKTVAHSHTSDVVKDAGSLSDDFGDLAETETDQLVNYSLQYGEDDGKSNNKVEAAELLEGQVPISIHEDTVKTYCTEDTPFETPGSLSLSDDQSRRNAPMPSQPLPADRQHSSAQPSAGRDPLNEGARCPLTRSDQNNQEKQGKLKFSGNFNSIKENVPFEHL